jgi:hypothetical protein
VNEKGVGHSGNAIVNESMFGSQDYGAWIQFLNIWTMLNCNNTEEVDKIYSNIRKCYKSYDDKRELYWPCKFDASTTMWSDNTGGILSIEYAGKYVYNPEINRYQHEWFRNVTDATIGKNKKYQAVNEDILWHANDLQWIKECENYQFTERQRAQRRANRAMTILNENHGKIDFFTIYNISIDRQFSKNPIYPSNPLCNICCGSRWYYKMLGTYFAWIIETKHNELPIVRWSPGSLVGESPCLYELSDWQEFKCSDYFN